MWRALFGAMAVGFVHDAVGFWIFHKATTKDQRAAQGDGLGDVALHDAIGVAVPVDEFEFMEREEVGDADRGAHGDAVFSGPEEVADQIER